MKHPRGTDTVESCGIIYSIHSKESCLGDNCTFHNPSNHSMRDWPFTLRMDRMALVERMCSHSVGHPDPDSVAFFEQHGPEGAKTSWGIHGCDGCCNPEGFAKVMEEASKRRHPASQKPKSVLQYAKSKPDPEPVRYISDEPDETWRDLVHRVAQEFCEYGTWVLDDDEKDFILWKRTAFPFGSKETVEQQVREEFLNLAEKQWSTRQEGR